MSPVEFVALLESESEGFRAGGGEKWLTRHNLNRAGKLNRSDAFVWTESEVKNLIGNPDSEIDIDLIDGTFLAFSPKTNTQIERRPSCSGIRAKKP